MTTPDSPVDSIAAWLVALPMRQPFSSARTQLEKRSVVLIRTTAAGSVGWGEAAPVPGHTEEQVEGLWLGLRLLVEEHGSAAGKAARGLLAAAFSQAEDDRSARDAGIPLWRYLGGGKRVAASAAIGTRPDGQPDLDQIASAATAGYRHMKLKVTPQTSAHRIGRITEEHPDVAFGVDANGALGPTERALIEALDGLGLSYIEQPGAATDLAFHAAVRHELATPVVLDESAATSRAIAEIVARGAADAINIKAGRFGTASALQLAKSVVAAGLQVRVGGLIETDIGRAHSVALASHPLFSMVGDLAASDRYFANDLATPPWRVAHGMLPLPTGPGIGIEPDESAVAAYAVDSLNVG